MKTCSTLSKFWIAGSVCWASVYCSASVAQEKSRFALVQTPDWSCISAEQESELVFYDSGEEENFGEPPTIDWHLSHGNRVLGRGSMDRRKIDDRDAYLVRLDLSKVELKSVVEAKLLLTKGDAEFTKTVFLFPADPFSDQQRVLIKAQMHLFDPVGNTKTIFQSAKIPFESINQLESIDSVEDALILVGEGVKPSRYSGLANLLSAAVARRNNVIWLVAGEGEIEFELKNQTRVVLDSEAVINRFDPRFDAVSWASKSPIDARWEPSQSDNRLSLKLSNASSAWPWVELHYHIDDAKRSSLAKQVDVVERRNGSSLVLCGLGIVERWDDGPVAKHLLLEMIRKSSNEIRKAQTATSKPLQNELEKTDDQ